jgi:NTE family protein
MWASVIATLNIMGSAIVAAKLALKPPDIVIRPRVGIFRTLDFYQATAILRAANAVKAEIKERLGSLLV